MNKINEYIKRRKELIDQGLDWPEASLIAYREIIKKEGGDTKNGKN